MASATQDRPKRKFKLLRSIHAQLEETAEDCVHCLGRGKTQEGFPCGQCKSTGKTLVSKMYRAGKPGEDIVESTEDLEALHGWEKFQSLDRLNRTIDNGALLEELAQLRAENAKLKKLAEEDSPEKSLESMTKAQLLDYAKSFDPPIDLSDASNNEERVNLIRNELDAM